MLTSIDVRARCLAGLEVPQAAADLYFELRLAPRAEPVSELEAAERLLALGFAERRGRTLVARDPVEVAWERSRRELRTLVDCRSPYQAVELVELDGDLALFLNEEIQFHSREQRLSHELMATLPACLGVPSPRRVLILGGGDGLAAGEVLRLPTVERVINVELDPVVVRIAREQPELVALNGGAFSDPRVEVVVGDALAFVLERTETFDLVIDDCEFGITGQPDLSVERYARYLSALPSRLTAGGVACLMLPLDPAASATLSRLESAFGAPKGGGGTRARAEALAARWAPHVASCRLESFFLDPELYVYLSTEPLSVRRRPSHPTTPGLRQALSQLEGASSGPPLPGEPAGS